jgi:hypothetical protein
MIYHIILIITLFLSCLSLSSCSAQDDSCSFLLNFDVTCRVLSEKENGMKLLEYFDADTNQLKLFIISSTSKIEIQHPYGKVKTYHDKIELNKIYFDPDNSNFLIVNGERFEIKELK